MTIPIPSAAAVSKCSSPSGELKGGWERKEVPARGLGRGGDGDGDGGVCRDRPTYQSTNLRACVCVRVCVRTCSSCVYMYI